MSQGDSLLSEKPKQSIRKDYSPQISLIDAYSNRRRPIVKNDVEDVIRCTEIRKISENEQDKNSKQINLHDLDERVEELRKRIEKAMNDLPDQSPSKSSECKIEKIKLLSESRNLAGACKTMLFEIHSHVGGEYCSKIISEVLEAAEGVTQVSERMIQKSNSIFQAQLIATKTEKMLKSLLDVVRSIKEIETKNSDSMKLLTAKSTTLTANIRQLLS